MFWQVFYTCEQLVVKDDITEQTKNMRDVSASKLKLAAEPFHVHSFVDLFS